MLLLAILFIITVIYLIYTRYIIEHFSINSPIDINSFNRNLIKKELDNSNIQADNYNFEPIDNDMIYRDDVTTTSNTFIAKDLEKLLKAFIVNCDHQDKHFKELGETDTINIKRFEFIVDKLLNMFQNAMYYAIFKTKQFKYIICPNINSCRIQLIEKKVINIKRNIKNNNIERWNIIIEFYITGKTNSFVLETLIEYFKENVLLLDVKIIGKNNNSIINIPKKYKDKSEIMKTVQPMDYRQPQLNIFNEKNTKYNAKHGYYMNNELDNITSFKTEKEMENEAKKYLSRQRISLSSNPNNYFIDEYKCYGSHGNNKQECENNYDTYFKSKNRGVWDTSCKLNTDCPFFRANKNYKNDFGGCFEGVCEMPLGIERLGNRYYDIDTKPLCHNCPENHRDCCDKQENPDYIFKDDIFLRKMNEQELNEKGLRMI
jgi:hypothetical protein